MTIEVTLIDAATGREIARSRRAEADLPADFLATTLQLGEETWRVERAVPPLREEYVRSGVLRLILRKAPPVKTVPAKLVRFSMSSITAGLPLDGEPANGNLALSLKDDLWRDVELVGLGHDSAIDENFAAIRQIHDEHRSGSGFTRIHLRTEPRTPLAGCHMTLAI